MKPHGEMLFRANRLFRGALLGLLVTVALMTGLAALAAPDQSYQLLQGIITSGSGRMITRYHEADGTTGQVIAPQWSTDGRYQMVSGFWSPDAFPQVVPTPRPTPVFGHQRYMPSIIVKQ